MFEVTVDDRVVAVALSGVGGKLYYLSPAANGLGLWTAEVDGERVPKLLAIWTVEGAFGPGVFALIPSLDGSRVFQEYCGQAECVSAVVDFETAAISDLGLSQNRILGATAERIVSFTGCCGDFGVVHDVVVTTDGFRRAINTDVAAATLTVTSWGEPVVITLRLDEAVPEVVISVLGLDGAETRPAFRRPMGPAGTVPVEMIGSTANWTAGSPLFEESALLVSGGRLYGPGSATVGIELPVFGGSPREVSIPPLSLRD
ncbi:MAG: hypothetical protein L0221_03090 [Chloroflexi bacterium]|nr:hypothetical protein [Chloroflexota bacterium]